MPFIHAPVLVRHGRRHKEMMRERVSISELTEALRRQGCTDIANVRAWRTMETSMSRNDEADVHAAKRKRLTHIRRKGNPLRGFSDRMIVGAVTGQIRDDDHARESSDPRRRCDRGRMLWASVGRIVGASKVI
jgi:hypothetical protein